MKLSQTEVKKARRAGLIAAAVLLAAGTLHLLKGHTRFSIVSYSLSAALFVLAGFFTALFIKITHAIGNLITGLLLAVVFYLVFTPTALIMRILGKDPLERKIDKETSSYWIKKEPVTEDITRYERQF